MITEFLICFLLVWPWLFPLLGGWLSRIMGGGWPDDYIPIPVQWFYAIPYGFLFLGSAHSSAWLALAAYCAAAVGARTANYPYFLLGTSSRVDTSRVPPLDFLIRWYFGAISPTGGQYWRDVAGLAVEGAAVTFLPGILYAVTVCPLAGALIALSGLSKAPAYMIELWLYKHKWYNQQAVIGEFLRGLFGWGILEWILLQST